MTDAQGFDVRIVYVCVVNATDNRDILVDFINNGGWNCLAKWLEYFMSTDKHAAIRELLKCFQKLPITAKTLTKKVDSLLPGKMIRTLKKHEDNDIKVLAQAIYKSWKYIHEEAERKTEKEKAVKRAEKQKIKKAEKREKAEPDKTEKSAPKKAKPGPTRKLYFVIIL